jgi:hypothetical protein
VSDEDDNITGDQNDDVDSDRADDADGSDQLGDAGKKALDAMKGKWQKERDERKALAAQVAQLNEQITKAQIRKEAEGDKPDAEKIREQAKAEARAEVLRDRAMDKVEAKAAKLFTDPEDARALLERHVENFIDGDKVDSDAIEEALADLLKKKPHLAAQSGGRFAGGADGGARKGSGKPQQLTAQQVKALNPEQLVAARRNGQLDDYMNS